MLTCRPLDRSNVREADAAWRIYAAAIPAREQKPREAIIAMAGDPSYAALGIWEGDRMLGMAMVLKMPEAGVSLLEYIAVNEQSRGQGVGAALFGAARDAALVHSGAMLVEVEKPCSDDDATRAVQERRCAFYRRMQCRPLDALQYILPLPGQGEPPLMELWIAAADRPTHIPLLRLRAWLEAVYRQAYGCSADDPRIASMLRGLPLRIAVG